MPLPLLVLLVVAGVGAVVLSVHLSGGSTVVRIGDEGMAARRFAADYPDEKAERIIVLPGGSDAVLLLSGGGAGLVHAMGHKFLTRVVRSQDISSVLG